MRSALIAVAALGATAGVAAAETPFQTLEHARREYRSNNFTAAIPLLKDLVYPDPKLARADDILEVHLLLGSCDVEIGDRNAAREEFAQALALQPEYALDTLLFSPGAVKLFDDTKAEFTARRKADEARRKAEADLEAARQQIANLRYYEVHPLGLNFVPFGIGQYQNDERRLGLMFSITQGVTFAGSAGIWYYLVNKYGYDGRVPSTDARTVRDLQGVEIYVGVAFFGLYAWSVIDGLLHYNYRTQIQAGDLPPSLLAPPPAPKTSLRDRLHFGPIVLQSGLGVGLSLED